MTRVRYDRDSFRGLSDYPMTFVVLAQRALRLHAGSWTVAKVENEERLLTMTSS